MLMPCPLGPLFPQLLSSVLHPVYGQVQPALGVARVTGAFCQGDVAAAPDCSALAFGKLCTAANGVLTLR
jgi:hypothetical protein